MPTRRLGLVRKLGRLLLLLGVMFCNVTKSPRVGKGETKTVSRSVAPAALAAAPNPARNEPQRKRNKNPFIVQRLSPNPVYE